MHKDIYYMIIKCIQINTEKKTSPIFVKNNNKIKLEL